MGPRQAGATVERQDRDNTQNRLRFGTESVYDHKSLEKNSAFCIIIYIIMVSSAKADPPQPSCGTFNHLKDIRSLCTKIWCISIYTGVRDL